MQVTFERRGKGRARETRRADYCISTIPLPLLRKLIDNETFAPDFKGAGRRRPVRSRRQGGLAGRGALLGVAGHQIYGGISWTDHPITQFWYPSLGTLRQGRAHRRLQLWRDGAQVWPLPLDERLMLATQGAERLHPEFLKFSRPSSGLDRVAAGSASSRRLGRLGGASPSMRRRTTACWRPTSASLSAATRCRT